MNEYKLVCNPPELVSGCCVGWVCAGGSYFIRSQVLFKASLCPMMELVCIVSPEAVSLSRRCWFVPQSRKRQAEYFEETQIFPPVRRVHGSALRTALKSPLGSARSLQQSDYEIMALNWSCGLGCQTLPGEAMDSPHAASEDVRWCDLLCCALSSPIQVMMNRDPVLFHDGWVTLVFTAAGLQSWSLCLLTFLLLLLLSACLHWLCGHF